MCIKNIEIFIMLSTLSWAIIEHIQRIELEKKFEATNLNVELGGYVGDCERIITLKNKSTGLFQDIFIILVENKDVEYVEKRCNYGTITNCNSIKALGPSINNGSYSYIDRLIEEKEKTIHNEGPGGNKENGLVLLFTSPSGQEWIVDTNNKVYKIKKKKEILKELGIQDPGYENPTG